MFDRFVMTVAPIGVDGVRCGPVNWRLEKGSVAAELLFLRVRENDNYAAVITDGHRKGNRVRVCRKNSRYFPRERSSRQAEARDNCNCEYQLSAHGRKIVPLPVAV